MVNFHFMLIHNGKFSKQKTHFNPFRPFMEIGGYLEVFKIKLKYMMEYSKKQTV